MYYPYGAPLREAQELSPLITRLKTRLHLNANLLDSRVIAIAATPYWQTIPAIEISIQGVFPEHQEDSQEQIAACLETFKTEKHGLILQSKDGGRGHQIYRLIPASCADQYKVGA